MSKLISGKEALIALANGEDVEYYKHEWMDVNRLSVRDLTSSDNMYKFRLKRRTITINNIEVPGPFNGELGHKQYAYVLNTAVPDGYSQIKFYEGNAKPLACWICEDEIKQVVSALRSVFKPQ